MKIITLGLICIMLLVIASCSKNLCTDSNAPNNGGSSPCTDLTTSLVGSYSGSFTDSVDGVGQTVTPGETVTITKIDDSHVQFTPANANFLPFTAKLSMAGSLYTFIVPSQTYQGITITGSSLAIGGTTVNGSYNTTSKLFLDLIQLDNSGTVSIEGFQGVKQ